MLGDAPVGIPPFFFNNYRLVLVDPKFLLLHVMFAILEMSFYFVLLAVWIEYQDLKFLNVRAFTYLHDYLTTHWSSLISFWSSFTFTRVHHLYPVSKWLNDLNVINMKLYMSHLLIPWGVMTSHLRSKGRKFIEG